MCREEQLIVDRLGGDVVFVCRSGQRAAQAHELLRRAGLSRGSVLEGGIVAWEGGGFEVDRGTERWDLERQVRLVAGSPTLRRKLFARRGIRRYQSTQPSPAVRRLRSRRS